jgi:hypothetical protein
LRQAYQRLEKLREREEKRCGRAPVTGSDVQAQLSNILKHLRPKIQYPKWAEMVDEKFNAEQRGVLYRMLDEIDGQIPWKGFVFADAHEAASQSSSAAGQ